MDSRLHVAMATELIIHANKHPEKLTSKNKLTGLPALTKLTASMQKRRDSITRVSVAGAGGAGHLQLCSLIGQSGVPPELCPALLFRTLQMQLGLGPDLRSAPN